MIKSVLCLY